MSLIELQECEIDNLGIKHDRRFMIIDDESNKFITQRKYASLCLLRPFIDVENNTLILTAEGQNPLRLPLTQDLSQLPKRKVTLWKDTLTVYDMGDQASAWVTQFLVNHREHDCANNHNIDDPVKDDEPVRMTRLVTLEDPKTRSIQDLHTPNWMAFTPPLQIGRPSHLALRPVWKMSIEVCWRQALVKEIKFPCLGLEITLLYLELSLGKKTNGL
ncbi:unnamed protein product [Rhizopus microsporus]